MAAPGAYDTVITLQSAVATALNGAVVNIDGLISLVIEITGTFAGLTCNFEASVDGSAWVSVALMPLGSPTAVTAWVAAATTAGLYRLVDCRGFSRFRARTSGSTGGSMTVKAVNVARQVQP